jgi:peroxiredoxin family protein
MTTTEAVQTAPIVVPDFGDDAPTGRKLAIICSKGNLDMAYPGLILANAALGEGVEVDLFFTFWGFDMITKSRMGDLKFTMLGNTATHMPQGLGGLPGMTAMATHQMRKQIHDIGVPDVPEFLEQIDAPMSVKYSRMAALISFLYELVIGQLLGCGQDRDGPRGQALIRSRPSGQVGIRGRPTDR